MRPKKPTLADLQYARNTALADSKIHLEQLKGRLQHGMDNDLRRFATRHPLTALGGAAVVGATAGVLFHVGPMRALLKGGALMVLGPMIEDMVARIVRMANGDEEPGTEAPAPAE